MPFVCDSMQCNASPRAKAEQAAQNKEKTSDSARELSDSEAEAMARLILAGVTSFRSHGPCFSGQPANEVMRKAMNKVDSEEDFSIIRFTVMTKTNCSF